MPRETIGTDGPFRASIGWSSSYVQVGTVVEDGRSVNWQLYGDDLAWLGEGIRKIWGQYESMAPDADMFNEQVACDVLNLLDCAPHMPSETPPPGVGYQGIWASLDRRDLNAMIRVLRRARDAAYGRDE